MLTGDALLVGDAGRPDLHAHGEHTVEEMAGTLYRSLTERLMTLSDHIALCPAHYSGSVCGRGLSANPISTVGFERRHNRALRFDSEEAFVAALLEELDRVVRDAGGAVYPAKDARMSPESFRRFFPQWERFAVHIDPKFSSSFWRRVHRS